MKRTTQQKSERRKALKERRKKERAGLLAVQAPAYRDWGYHGQIGDNMPSLYGPFNWEIGQGGSFERCGCVLDVAEHASYMTEDYASEYTLEFTALANGNLHIVWRNIGGDMHGEVYTENILPFKTTEQELRMLNSIRHPSVLTESVT